VKKFLTSGLTLALLLGLASISMASTVYLDVLTGGNADVYTTSNDLSQISLGLDLPLDEFKFTCNLTSGSINDYLAYNSYRYDIDTASILVKGGYALINDRQLRLDVTGGFYNRTIDWDYLETDRYYDKIETESFYSLTVGLDAKLKLDRKAWIDFSYSFGLNPQVETEYYLYSTTSDLDSISLLNLKFNYLFTPEFGASLGYNCETIDYEGSYKDKYSGLTVGAFFRF
jgi:hypothetical protein